MASYPQPEILDLFERLNGIYGPLHWWPADSDYEVCIGAILTQNTAWSNVEKAITALKNAGALNQETLIRINLEELADLIRPSGFFNIKSLRIKAFAEWLELEYNGSLENMFAGNWRELRNELLEVSGIGPETCDAILLYAGRKPSFVVDNYTKRILGRLGLFDGKGSYGEIRRLFMNNLPEDAIIYNELHAAIVEHCKQYCRKKPLCRDCPLKLICSYVCS